MTEQTTMAAPDAVSDATLENTPPPDQKTGIAANVEGLIKATTNAGYPATVKK